MQQTPVSERSNNRQPVLLGARCRTSSWHVSQVELANISEGGCCIIGGAEGLREGQSLSVSFAGLKGVPGTVRWVKGADAGVAFDAPVPSEKVAHLTDAYRLDIPGSHDFRKSLVTD